jgi:hypothetical protein
MIPRRIESKLTAQLREGTKVIILYGARQVGKTTLIQQILAHQSGRTLVINADEARFSDVLSSRDLRRLRGLVDGYEILFLDEAQRVPEIGINLKLLADNVPSLRIIATGSSSLDLASKVREPLTGRAWAHTLYPIAYCELASQHNAFELDDMLPERLIYGSYPEIFSLRGDERRRDYLRDLTASYLFKDILEIGGIRNSVKLRDLLKLLAFQIGSEVSLAELGSQLQMSKDTVASYLDLLEQSFVVFRLKGFNRNLRKEVSKQDKVYFWDIGVRNTLIDNLKPLPDRNDAGQLWENFLIAEHRKWLAYNGALASVYFWRTYTGAELDMVEERDGKLQGFEYKWGKGKARVPTAFLQTYAQATFDVITRENYLTHIGAQSPNHSLTHP